MKKRAFSIILSACMLFGLLPMTAFADSCDGADCGHVAAIGGEHFASIQDAVVAAGNGDTIVVIRDHEMDCSRTVINSGGYSALVNVAEKEVTIDLNGKEITVKPSSTQFASAKSEMLLGVFVADTNGTLTLKDSGGSGCVMITANNADIYSLAACYGEGGALSFESGTYSLDYSTNALIYSQYDEVVTVSGGTFCMGNVGTLANGSPWVFNAKGQNERNIVVNGGKFNADILHQYYPFEIMAPREKALRKAYDNTLQCDMWTMVDAVAYVNEQHRSGSWYTNEVGYATFEEAAEAAKEYASAAESAGKTNTITLLTDCRVDEIQITEDINIDLNGNKIVLDMNTDDPVIELNGTGKLTIEEPEVEKDGYEFEGWFSDAEFETPFLFEEQGPTTIENKTLYVKWAPVSYSIAYSLDGGIVDGTNPAEYTIESTDITLVNPTKTGYAFAGWTGTGLTEPAMVVTIPAGSTGDREYTANWTPVQLTGTVTITGTAQVGGTLTAAVSDSNNTGALSYKWYRCEADTEVSVLMGESANNVYVISEDAVAQRIYCVVSSNVQTGTLVSGKTGVVPNLVFPGGVISAEGYTGIYDGQPHGIAVTVPEGATVYYGTDGETCELGASPTYTNAGTYTIYYRVVKDNYDGVIGSAVVSIGKAEPIVTAWPTVSGTVYVNAAGVTLKDDGTVNGVDGAALDGSFELGAVDLTTAGEKTVTVTFVPDSENFTSVEKADFQINVRRRRVEPTYPPVIVTDGDGETAVSNERPKKGDKVTITVEPDEGYRVDEVTVTDRNGEAVEVTKNEDGTYSFTQPVGEVTVDVSHICAGTHGCPTCTYTDLNSDQWYHESTDYAIKNGLMNGVGNGEFDPTGTTSRAMIVTILWRLEGEPVVNYLMQFEDVSAETWYTEAVRWAASEKIVEGYSKSVFGTDDAITREQFATILWRYAKAKGYDMEVGEGADIFDFQDALSVSEYAVSAMKWACGSSLMEGDGVHLTPMADATRVQAAALFQRFCEKIAE